MDLNILRVHVEDDGGEVGGGGSGGGRSVLRALERASEHLPFLASASLFRISSVLLLLTYLNAFAFFPVAAFWFCCLAIGYRR